MDKDKSSDWFWTAEQVVTLITMANANYSAGDIAQPAGNSRRGADEKVVRIGNARVH